jgi:hypothetical protein
MAYPPGNKFAWNGIVVRPRMPVTGGTVNGEPFTVVRGAKVLQIHIPAMTGTGTVLLQALAPTEIVEATEVWSDITVFDLTDGTFEKLDGLPESTCVTIPVSATGGGTLRFVGSEDQSGAAFLITVFQSFDG